MRHSTYRWFESRKIWANGLVIDELCETPSHWNKRQSLHEWLVEQGVPAIRGVDTRLLTQKIREHGTMLGKIVVGDENPDKVPEVDPSKLNLVAEVSIKVEYNIASFKEIRQLSFLILLHAGAPNHQSQRIAQNSGRRLRIEIQPD